MLKAFDSASPDVVGRLDLSHAARRVVPSQTQPVVFPGTIKELFLFVAVVSWTFTFMFIHILPRLEEEPGVGDRQSEDLEEATWRTTERRHRGGSSGTTSS